MAYKTSSDYRCDGEDVDRCVLKALFQRPYFHVSVIEDIASISIAGALKKVTALGCGFIEGLWWVNNSSAAIQRVGKIFFPEYRVESFHRESAGVTELITTYSCGRNVKVAKCMADTGKTALDAERELLNGQSAQGIITCKEVHELLETYEFIHEYPLLEAVYQIV